jgi:type II secretory pathway component PulF
LTKYSYKAKKSLNDSIEGVIEANSVEQAVELLVSQGYVPVSVDPAQPANAQRAAVARQAAGVSGGWGAKQRIVFTQKLQTLVKAGVELIVALRLLQQHAANPSEKALLDDMIANIKDGLSFSDALARYPRHFPLLYTSIIKTGENSGKLKESLAVLTGYLEIQYDLQLKVKQALAYPAFLLVIGLVMAVVMLTFIMPQLLGMFNNFHAALPLPTRIMMAISNGFTRHWPWISAGAVLLAAAGSRPAVRAPFVNFLRYRLPLVRGIVAKEGVVNFSICLAILLRSGVPLLSALRISAPVIGNSKHTEAVAKASEQISAGIPFSQALAQFSIFPAFFIQMIQVGEKSGRLDTVLDEIAGVYRKEIESDLKIAVSLIEPVVILVIGLVIGGMVAAVLLPIFNITSLFPTT